MSEDKKFWLVWNPQSGRTNYRHLTRKLAADEAVRLAQMNPGQTFHVIEAVLTIRPTQPPVDIVLLSDPTETEIATAEQAAVRDAEILF